MPRSLLASFATLCLVLALAACAPAAPPAPVVPIQLLEVWRVQSGAVTADTPVIGWQFAADTAAPIRSRVSLTQPTDAAVQVTLKDASGGLLAAGSDISIMLPTAGVYTLEIRLVSGERADYTVHVIYTDRAAPPTSMPTLTPAPTSSPIPSLSPTPQPTITQSYTPSTTPTITPTLTASPTPSATLTPSATFTPTATFTPSLTPTAVWAALGSLIGAIAPGQTATGVLISTFDRHIYTFNGTAGQVIDLRAETGDPPLDPALTIYDPTGAALAYDDDSGGGTAAQITRLILDSDGVYVAQVVGGGIDAGATGAYRLTLFDGLTAQTGASAAVPPTSTPTPVPLGIVEPVIPVSDALTANVPIRDALDRPGAVRRYLITARPGQIVTIGARPVPGSGVRPRLEVINPGGDSMIDLGASPVDGAAIIPMLSLLEGGVYSVFVTGDGTGEFILGYGDGESYADVSRGEAPAGLPVSGALPGRGFRDRWTVALNAGDQIDVDVLATSPDFDPAVTVIGPDGQPVAQGDNENGLNAQLRAVTIPRNGPYVIAISGSGANTFGAYLLTWRVSVSAPTPTATPPSIPVLTASDALPAQTYLYYPLVAEVGDVLRVSVIGGEGVDPAAALIDAAGVTVIEVDDTPAGLNPEFELTIPAAGRYRLRVSAYGGAVGAVTVRVERLLP